MNGNNTNTVNPTITQTPTVTQTPTITANPTNTNTNTANPTNTNTADQKNTSNNDNKNDNRSSATNNNTIYIYPPSYPPPAPPPVAAQTSILPPLVAPPALDRYAPLDPYGPSSYRPQQRVRLSCAQLCGPPPAPISPVRFKKRERIRYVSLGGHVTALGLANQPLAGWGTLWGGGVSLQFRSRGHFGFEMSQDFLHGTFGDTNGAGGITRESYPFELTFKGYILPNLDKHHFNMYFGGGVGAMESKITFANDGSSQHFLEWMIHGDIGAELRFNWFQIGIDGRIQAMARDRNFGDGAYYGDIKDAPVPASTWGVEGRGYLNFWF